MALLDLFPPDATTVPVAGRELTVRPLTLAGLASLDAAVAAALPFVRETLPDGLEGWAARRHWAKLFKKARAWPPEWSALSSTVPGKSLLLRRVTDLDVGESVAVAEAATAEEWAAVLDAAHGRHPLDLYLRLMDPDRPMSDPGAEGITLEQAVAEMCREFGYTPAQVGALTFTQFRSLRLGGAKPRKLHLKPGETMLQATAERRRLLAEEEDAGDPAISPKASG